MTKKIVIAKPQISDLDTLISWGKSNRELRVSDDSTWYSKEDLINWLNETPEKDAIFVAKVDGTIAGMCLMYVNHGWAYVSSLYVDKPFRKLGVGKLLLKHAQKHLLKQGIDNMHLVTEKGAKSEDFYKHIGFDSGYTFVWYKKRFKEEK